MLLAESLLGTSSATANYIEDVFSTYLYTGNGSNTTGQTITNNVDLSTKGGMVWIKCRDGANNHVLFDTTRGAGTTASNNQAISSNLTSAEDIGSSIDYLSSFNANGFTVKQGGVYPPTLTANSSNELYTSWTFRKQAKFFDVVTYTGTGANRTIAHNLGSVPGCIMIKRTDTTAAWAVYHRSISTTQYMVLNTTAAAATGATYWNSTTPTSSVFSLGTSTDVNASGGTYVAYLFAHDAGGFGATGADNVISCGSYTGNGSTTGPTITLGYEPQWVLIKTSTFAYGGDWNLIDNMRGFVVGGTDVELNPNVSTGESTGTVVTPTASGFQINTTNTDYNASPQTYIYIAIRRGPMRTPTTGTSVFAPVTFTGGTTVSATTNFPVDLALTTRRNGVEFKFFQDRMRGGGNALTSTGTDAEFNVAGSGTQVTFASNTGVTIGNSYSGDCVLEAIRRAPGFFDVVCYTGTGANRTVSHNLGVAPELMIVKPRSSTGGWQVYSASTGSGTVLLLNGTGTPASDTTTWNNTAPTASVFSLGTSILTNNNTTTYVAYLFATVAGVSKVGSYTGSGTTKQIDCGFTGGARFVLIKRTDSTGDWYVWDSARGIVAGNDPYLLLNSTAAEVTGTDYVDTYSAGFEISSTAPAAINANGGTFIFLAIA